MIINLAVNARDAMPDGGTPHDPHAQRQRAREPASSIGLGVAAGEYVLIEVEDTGTGMTPEVMAKIFEPFFTTKEVGKGTGLGLSTVYGIVKQTGGYIFAESDAGQGHDLPRLPAAPHRRARVEEIAAAAQGGRRRSAPRDLTGTGRVLLVEDEDAVRNFAVARAEAPGLRGARGRRPASRRSR